jgi:MYXO-CTERM domain-containing protein
MPRLRQILVGLVAFAISHPAGAVPLLLSFTGTIESVDPALAAEFSVGESVSGSIRYEPTTPDSEATSLHGRYEAIERSTFRFGSHTATGSEGTIALSNQNSARPILSLPLEDRFDALTRVTGASFGGFAPFGVWLIMQDTSMTAFVSDSLPTELDLADFDSALVHFFFDPGSQGLTATISTISVTPAPEPAVGAMVLAGLVALGLGRRRGRL